MAPRVSVITPFLNAGRYLAPAIESVRAQTLTDWELILVDDGSSDDSPQLAASFAAADPERIKVLPPDPARKGAAAARNRGLAASRADLVACLDADDLLLPRKLARDVAAMDADPGAVWVYSASRWFFEGGAGRDWEERTGVWTDRTYGGPAMLVRVLLRERGDVPCPCAVTIRREPMERLGGFEERFRLYEDQALWAKLLLDGPVRVRSGCDALYRQHPASTSTAATERGEYDQHRPHAARRLFLDWLREYCDAKGAGPEVLAAIDDGLKDCEGGALRKLAREVRRRTRYLPFLP